MTVSGGTAVAGFGRQAALGTALTVPKFELPMGDGGIQPDRQTAELPWTFDSRDPVGHYVSRVSGDFAMTLPALPVSLAGLLQGGLGTLDTTGVGAPFEHEALGADSLPWMTWFFGIGGEYLTLADAKINRLVLSATAGQPLSARVEGMGKTVARTEPETKWAAADMVEDEQPFFTMIDAVLKLEAATTPATTVVHNLPNFELTIENNLDARQTDGIGYSIVAEGRRNISVAATDVILEDFDFLKATNFGSTSGTALSGVPVYGSVSATFKGSDGVAAATRGVTFDLLRLHWEGGQWPGADPSRAPVTYAIRGLASTPDSGDIISATTINGSAGSVY